MNPYTLIEDGIDTWALMFGTRRVADFYSYGEAKTALNALNAKRAAVLADGDPDEDVPLRDADGVLI